MKLYIIDGNSLLFRAYYATSFTGNIMRRKDGFPTNAIFGFSNMITKITSFLKEDDLIFVAFDSGKKTFRSELLESYKAQRKPIEEDLAVQLPVAREYLKAMNIVYYEKEGFEGDDIAGSVAKLASKRGIKTFIYTSDKDYLQLIDDNITIEMIKKGLTDIESMNEVSLKEKMGLTPDQIKDYKGLMGDPSDNLKGIPGIGEKTALKLIQEYGSLENIIEEMKNQKSKIAEKIIENQDLGLLCKKMATIITDMDIPFTLESLQYEGYDYNALSSFYTTYECYSLIKKLKPNDKRKVNDENQVEEEKIEVIRVNKFKDIPLSRTIIIDQEKGNYNTSPINGFAFSKDGIVYYLPFDKAIKDRDFINFMKDENIKKITYDYKALKVALSHYNIDVNGLEFDLILASYLLNSSIENSPVAIYGYYKVNISFKNDSLSLLEEENSIYNMVYHLERLYPTIIDKLKEIDCYNLYVDMELPLADILSEMEIEGFPVSRKVLEDLSNDFKKKIEEITNKIYELAGYEFNLSSPKQVADLLFHKLNLPSNKKESTSIEVLSSLASKHPIVPLIIEHRKYSKLLSVYSEGLISNIYLDGKIHTIFNQALTQTGRLSSSEPNLQNISTRSEEGKNIKKAFFYDEGYSLLSLDYSQIELRILASMSECEDLINTFNNDEDIHSTTAMKVFNLTKEELTSEYRQRAKAVNFGIVYGISDWGLAEQISSSVKEAHSIIAAFNEHYPEIETYFNKVIDDTIKNGYSKTLFGRRRYISEIFSSSYNVREFGKRAAMNATIQGTGADIIKMAMISISRYLKEHEYKTKIVLQIHDELIFKVPHEEETIILPTLKKLMEEACELKVKLKVEGSYGKTWYDCK